MSESNRHEASERDKRIQRVLDRVLRRRAAGEELPDEAVIVEHPDLMPELQGRLRALGLIERAGEQANGADRPRSAGDSKHISGKCPHCGASWRLRERFAGRRARCKKCGEVFMANGSSRPGGAASDAAAAAGLPTGVPGYEIEKELGHGGMGCVYRARQLSTKRTVALKVMLAGRHANERMRRRFEREVEIAASLEHPHIARIYASGLHEGHHWFAMEHVDGERLDNYVARERLGLRDLLSVFGRICDAVNHAHQRGVMHRDLKPGNILVDEHHQPRVLDFGLAKLLDRPAESEESISLLGEVMGTPAYMSPEQTQGDSAGVDIRSDVYSLGVILYRLLTGQSPYGEEGSLPELLRAISETDPQPPRSVKPGLPEEVSAIVLKALEKDPERRYQSAGEMGRDIASYLAGDPVTARQASGWYMLRKNAVRYKGVATAVAAVVVLSLTLGLTMAALWAKTRIELREVVKEVEVIREREAEADQTLRADLVAARKEIERLRNLLTNTEAEAKRLRAQLPKEPEPPAWGFPGPDGKMVYPPPPNPADPVNYIDWLNEAFGGENAADDYLAAYDLLEGIQDDETKKALGEAMKGPWSGDQRLSVWLRRSRPALGRFREGTQKAKCYFPAHLSLEGEQNDLRTRDLMIGVLLPQLASHRTCAKALIAEGWHAWQSGDENLLANNTVAVLASAHHFTDSPAPLVQFMVADLCAKRAYDALRYALGFSTDPDSLAARISVKLIEDDPPLSVFAPALRFEKLWCWDFCQRVYIPGKKKGTWGLHWSALSVLRPEDFKEPPDPMPSPEELMLSLKPHGVSGYEETIQEINAFFDSAIEWSEASVREAGRAAEIERIPQETKNAVARSLMPSLVRMGALHDRSVANRRATHLIVHLFTHHAKTGSFPSSLRGLDAPDLEQLLIDPFSGGDFVYTRTGEGFTLYSLADDLKDDGGQHDPKWEDGDYVFWPVQGLAEKQTAFDPPPPNPAEPVNYIEWMNETFSVDDTANAANDYIAAYKQIEKFEGSEQDQAALTNALTGPWSANKKITDWLAANRSGLAKFRQASEKSECFFPATMGGQEPPEEQDDPRLQHLMMSLQLPDLGKHRSAAKALIVEGWRTWQAGNQNRLTENAVVVLRSARHLEQKPGPLFQRLTAAACAKSAYDAVRNALSLSGDPEELAAAILPDLREVDPAPPPFAQAFLCERLWNVDVCQRLYMPGRQRGTWVPYVPALQVFGGDGAEAWGSEMGMRLAQRIAEVGLDETLRESNLPNEVVAVMQELAGFGFDRTLREIDAYWKALDEWCTTPYHLVADRSDELDRMVKDAKSPVAKLLLPALSRSRLLGERRVVTRRATHLIVHLFAHHARTGSFPSSLRRLDAPDLEQLRIDPFSGRDFKYKRVSEGFTLYSLADNLEDDRGQHDPKWKTGDYVFWPVQK